MLLYDEGSRDEVTEQLCNVVEKNLDLLGAPGAGLLLRIVPRDFVPQALQGLELLPHVPNELGQPLAPHLHSRPLVELDWPKLVLSVSHCIRLAVPSTTKGPFDNN